MQTRLSFIVLCLVTIFRAEADSTDGDTDAEGVLIGYENGALTVQVGGDGVRGCRGSHGYEGYSGGHPRFSKIQLAAKEAYRDNMMGATDYPVQYSCKLNDVLNSFCPSVTMPHDYEVKDDITEMVHAVGYPSHPLDGYGKADPRFWEEFRFLVRLQLYRRYHGGEKARNIMPLLPKLWWEYSINDVAEAVHDEYPGLHQSDMLANNAKNKDPHEASGPFFLELDPILVGKRCRTRFLHSIVAVAKFNTMTIDMVAPVNFAAKWYVGRARPEEVAWKIAKGVLNEKHGIPKDILDMVRLMKLRKMEDFGAYAEGCPQHPSYPAMHSAASSLSVWMLVVTKFKISDYEIDQAIKTDVAVACARTVAGVHFVSDNLSGLKMGQKVIYKHLASYMAKHYDSDPNIVNDKINKVSFLWDHYMDKYCNIYVPDDFDPFAYASNGY